MEVKINREIMNYKESIFFGLSMRQFIFSACACISAVVAYFLLKPYLNTEVISWICVAIAFPFAVFGFVTYNGMTAEKFLVAWIKYQFLIPKKLMFQPSKSYENYMKRRER